ncbi:MAG TPA: hypothetical protein VGL17_05975, partial [Gemmatimonadaceae bacterium]
MAREQLFFEDAGLVCTHGLAERIRHGTFEPSVIFHWDEVRVVLTEPRQHAGVHFTIEIVHHER